jgi:hypothetical protein
MKSNPAAGRDAGIFLWGEFLIESKPRIPHLAPMPRKADPNRQLRGKMNLTIHPEIRAFADELALKRRRSISQLFEDLVEAEWARVQAGHAPTPSPAILPAPQVAQAAYPQVPYYYPPQFVPVPPAPPAPQG